jgi:8-oxo-dGTP pyrophosphatase MutT (NUDIX family)
MQPAKVRFHFIRRYRADEVAVETVSDRRPRIDEIESAIEQAWQEARARPGVKLFDGEMCRLEYFRAGRTLELGLSGTSYKIFWGTNLTHPEFADRYGWEALANPVGLSCALESADGFLMLGRRNASVAYYPLRVHPFAGSLEPAQTVDLFADARRELAEELGFGVADVAEIDCIGLVEDCSLRQPELVFGVRSARSQKEIESAVVTDEHEGCVAIPARPEDVQAALADPALTPVAMGTILLWGHGRFGPRWFDAAERAVNLRHHESR